jgi:hypothetical protein
MTIPCYWVNRNFAVNFLRAIFNQRIAFDRLVGSLQQHTFAVHRALEDTKFLSIITPSTRATVPGVGSIAFSNASLTLVVPVCINIIMWAIFFLLHPLLGTLKGARFCPKSTFFYEMSVKSISRVAHPVHNKVAITLKTNSYPY